MITFSKKVSFIRSTFGQCQIDNSQQNAAVECPSCGSGSGKKKFSINLNNWNCHCWVCGLKGKTLFPILKKFKSRDCANEFSSFFLGGKVGQAKEIEEQHVDKELELPEGFLLLADSIRSIDPDIQACIHYFYDRGFQINDLWRYMIGTVTKGRFRRRIIVPSFNSDGFLNYFTARAIDKNQYRKYINANANKRDIIFNEINIDWNTELTIVEGPFDFMKAGFNSTCLLGSSLNERSPLLCKIIANRTPVLLALDSDMKEKEQKSAEMLASYDCEVRILDLGDKHDVGEMSRSEFNNLKSQAEFWNKFMLLRQRIKSINSGSLI